MPRVSVIIPTHNRAHVVGQAIDSVFAQTYQDFEIIVVDDASTDNVGEVLSRYLVEHPDKVRVIWRETNGGRAAARNDGIRASTGGYIAFLDSDDLWLPARLEVAVQFLDADASSGAVFTDGAEIYANGEVAIQSKLDHIGFSKPVATWRDVLYNSPMNTDTFTIRRECLDAVGLFDERLLRGEDSELWTRVCYHYRVACVPRVCAMYRNATRRWRKTADGARPGIEFARTVLGWLPSSDEAGVRYVQSYLARVLWRVAARLSAERSPDATRAHKEAVSYCVANRLWRDLAASHLDDYAPKAMAFARRCRDHVVRWVHGTTEDSR